MNYTLALNNTDKFYGGINGTNVGHNYQLLYKNFLNNDLKSILEIGTAYGGFAKFLRQNNIKSKIIGADIAPCQHDGHVSDYSDNNSLYDDFYVGDAFSETFLNWLNEKKYAFDLVIEDAGHSRETQEYMLRNFYKFLNPNGVYICEDIQTYDTAIYLTQCVPDKYKKFCYIWDGRFSINRYDDVCIVIDLR